jgi:hypothetical protein
MISASIKNLISEFYGAARGKPELFDGVITDDWQDIHRARMADIICFRFACRGHRGSCRRQAAIRSARPGKE